MARKRVIGVEPVSYTGKNGNPVRGVRIHIATELMSPSIGESVANEFISQADINDYHLGPVQAVLYEPGFGGRYRCTGVIYDDIKK